MRTAQVIKGVFLPAASDERWLYDSANDVVTLGDVQIRWAGGYYALKIGDAEVSKIEFSSVRGTLGFYCVKTRRHHQELYEKREAEEKLHALAEASEKHVAGLIE